MNLFGYINIVEIASLVLLNGISVGHHKVLPIIDGEFKLLALPNHNICLEALHGGLVSALDRHLPRFLRRKLPYHMHYGLRSQMFVTLPVESGPGDLLLLLSIEKCQLVRVTRVAPVEFEALEVYRRIEKSYFSEKSQSQFFLSSFVKPRYDHLSTGYLIENSIL